MDPDDSFSPPLNGALRGRKIHQVSSALGESDIIRDVIHSDPLGEGHQVTAVVSLDTFEEAPSEVMGIMLANWWHNQLEPDWWEYQYLEFDPQDVLDKIEEMEDPEEMEVEDVIHYGIGWICQVNEKVEGLKYTNELVDESWEQDPFDPEFESAKPLTKEIVDNKLAENINSRY